MRVTLVDRKNYFAHNLSPFCVLSRQHSLSKNPDHDCKLGMAPLAKLLKSSQSRFVHANLLDIDPVANLVILQPMEAGSDPQPMKYDYVVFALGSRYGMPGKVFSSISLSFLDHS